MAQMSEPRHKQIAALCARGDALLQHEKYLQAIEVYKLAWDLLPEPRTEWDAAVWIQAAIADAYFLTGEFRSALEPLRVALVSGGAEDAFVHLRLGQCLLEMGDAEQAIQELTRAYALGGRELFANDDPKYLDALRKVLDPPIGQDDL